MRCAPHISIAFSAIATAMAVMPYGSPANASAIPSTLAKAWNAAKTKFDPSQKMTITRGNVGDTFAHINLVGHIYQNSGDLIALQLRSIVQDIGKKKNIYLNIYSHGGSVEDGWKILEEMNNLYDQGYRNIRSVSHISMSMGFIISSAYKGLRFVNRNAQNMLHASRIEKNGKVCLINDACTTAAEKRMIAGDITKFARALSRRSCGLDEDVARFFIEKGGDVNLNVNSMLQLNLADHEVEGSGHSYYRITRSVNRQTCGVYVRN